MTTLPEQFTRNGFEFEQMHRNGLVAVYRKRKPEWTQGKYSFETVIIRERKESEAFGKTFQAAECFPSSEQWGQFGFTYTCFAHAMAKAAVLIPSKSKNRGSESEMS